MKEFWKSLTFVKVIAKNNVPHFWDTVCIDVSIDEMRFDTL